MKYVGLNPDDENIKIFQEMNPRVLYIISLFICLMLSFQSCQKELQAERQLDDIIEDIEDSVKANIYAYPARVLAEKDYYYYKDAVYTGSNPSQNNIFITSPEEWIGDFDDTKLCLNLTAGSHEITIMVYDFSWQLVAEKTLSIVAAPKPIRKLESTDELPVFFFGDSIINQNKNQLGKDFTRELNSICDGKIRLVGSKSYRGTQWEYCMYLENVFTGKNDVNNALNNPFYNPDSIEPDELGEDGFNKRVDFQWYFETICGNGKYPKLFYISIGANDMGRSDGWSGEIIPDNAKRLISLCKKIKSACDDIEGGESNIVIKLFNHQTYPLNINELLGYGIDQRRIIQNYAWDVYYEAVTSSFNGVSDYVEIVDCASHFDWERGYNPNGDNIHMNSFGASQYANILVDDFLADPRFD